MYCPEVWGDSSKKDLNRIHKLQKRALNVLGACDWSQVNVLNIDQIIRWRLMILMYTVLCKTAPEFLMRVFIKLPEVHEHNTRALNYNFYVSRNIQVKILSQAVQVWNALPLQIKQSNSKEIFKKRSKHFLRNSGV